MIFKGDVQKLDREAGRHSFYLCKTPDLKEATIYNQNLYAEEDYTHFKAC